MKRFCMSALVALLAVGGVPAVAATVISAADSGPGSLRQAITDAAPGDTIDFALAVPTITLTSGEMLVDKNLTIQGPGAANLTISGNHASRIFVVAAGVTVAMDGLTIADGSTGIGGGGIRNTGTLTVTNSTLSGNTALVGGGIWNNGTLTLTNSTLSGNSASLGGGIDNIGEMTMASCTLTNNTAPTGAGISNAGTLTVTNTAFSGNPASDNGGGIRNSRALTVTDCTFSGNSAKLGGGILNDGTLTVTSSAFSGNTADTGGGIWNGGTLTAAITNSTLSGGAGTMEGGGIYNKGTLTVSHSTVTGNSAFLGGGISNNGTVNLMNSTVSGNSVTGSGGGSFNSGTLTVTDSTVFGNSANFGGGIINNNTLTVTNSTFSGNSANQTGGGIHNSGTLTVTHSTFSGNSAPSGGGGIRPVAGTTMLRHTIIAYSFLGGNCDGDPIVSSGYNLSSDASCGLAQIGDQNSVDPLLDVLADNGGSTLTHALLPGSPAIDIGGNALVSPDLATDQRGADRIADGNGDAVAIVDVGAFEFQPTAPPPSGEPADLFVVQRASTRSQKGSMRITYTVTVRNLGPGTARGVIVHDTPPDRSAFAGASATTGSLVTPDAGMTGVVTWTAGDLPPGAEASLTLTVNTTARGQTTVTNTATASSASPDPDPANNTSSLEVRVSGPTK